MELGENDDVPIHGREPVPTRVRTAHLMPRVAPAAVLRLALGANETDNDAPAPAPAAAAAADAPLATAGAARSRAGARPGATVWAAARAVAVVEPGGNVDEEYDTPAHTVVALLAAVEAAGSGAVAPPGSAVWAAARAVALVEPGGNGDNDDDALTPWRVPHPTAKRSRLH